MSKIRVYHFHNGGGGGVLSVIQNLLKYSKDVDIESHVIHTVNKKQVPNYILPGLKGALSERVFYYNPKANFYHTCRELKKLLPDDKVIIVAHDWMELGMASNLGLNNPVVQFLHGDFDYYYNLAKTNNKAINKFITVSSTIYKKLCQLLPDRQDDIQYCRFPVPEVRKKENENKLLKLFYCVNALDEERKQFKVLPLINKKLKEDGVDTLWTVIGSGLPLETIENMWGDTQNLAWVERLKNEEILNCLPGNDIFILPSLAEGFPVSVVEAMKAGVVPLITNWKGATDELLIPGETGYYLKPGAVDEYAATISMLNNDRVLLNRLSANAIEKANSLFDPYINTKNIESIFYKASQLPLQKKAAKKIYGSLLDEAWIPNFITQTIRRG